MYQGTVLGPYGWVLLNLIFTTPRQALKCARFTNQKSEVREAT